MHYYKLRKETCVSFIQFLVFSLVIGASYEAFCKCISLFSSFKKDKQ